MTAAELHASRHMIRPVSFSLVSIGQVVTDLDLEHSDKRCRGKRNEFCGRRDRLRGGIRVAGRKKS